ncbi:poly [ADP-ribose] polymerase 1 [Rana temporaria]|uniref:poly [ADP-ribose] polymerase 1 n=1 Tax=Rana temporaria TaxID=8407 RepID=UPI001AAD443D|nr:poly [ADP-ribose] polymerase 1 [Rana temporaria]
MAESTDKLYRAEYAKSGRASCKKCGDSIAKQSLRLALMVQSPMFDGKVPHWHHYACFWKRARVLSHGDIDGFTELRWEDQEKIKKAVETGGASAGAGGGDAKGGKADMTLNDFGAEYAKSNRSTCKGCEQKIEKGQIRLSKKSVDVERPQLGMIDRWYHPDCFVSRREELGFLPMYNASQMKGFIILNAEDQEALKAKLPAVKNEGKRKGDELDGSAMSKKKLKKEKEKESKLEKLLKEQTELVWSIKDELKKVCSTNDLKELLIANKQQVPSGETNILDRVSDGMAFGALLPCEECQGQVVFKTDAYYCTGDISAWTKCVAKTQTPSRKDWVTPKEFHEVPYLKKFKFKRQDRAFPPSVAPTPVSAPAPAKLVVKEEVLPEGKPLTNMTVMLIGKLSKNKDDVKTIIEELGGKTTGSANKATVCVSTQKEVEKMSKKMEDVKAANIRVVSEDFLNELQSGKSCQDLLAQHGISTWGAEIKQEAKPEPPAKSKTAIGKSTGKVKEEQGSSKAEKKMKLTVKGGAAVDPDSGLENSCHVLEKSGQIFSATLGLVDISRGTNSYYKLQLIEHDRDARFWVFRSWGRVGTVIGSNKLEEMSSKEEAVDHFLNLYQDKTGNAWHSTNFTKYPNKFYPLEIDYGQEEDVVKKLSVGAGTKSKLAKPVQELIKLIFDVESMKKAMVEFEIDLQKMPLGKLSKRQIQSAYSILNDVQQAVSDNAPESRLLDLSNRFYTLIPHDFGMKKPPLLDNVEYIQAKVQMLDNLLDIEVAYSLLRGGTDDSEKDPIDVKYEKVKTDIKVIDKDSEEAKIIHEYVKNTHAETHNAYELEVLDVFKIEREGERQRYKPFKQLHNRQLLWHGSRTTNFAGILSQGLRIAPPEAPVTGYMFGKGVYFADMVSKSANYCHTTPSNSTGLILLGEVALGSMYELKAASHITKLPKGKHSVKGLGRTAPDPTATVQLDGVDVPLGKGMSTNINDTSLMYNEYIVYDIAQVNLKYLLKLKFNYKGGLLW